MMLISDTMVFAFNKALSHIHSQERMFNLENLSSNAKELQLLADASVASCSACITMDNNDELAK